MIPKYLPEETRQALLYLKQIGALETKKRGFVPTENFRQVYARMLVMLIFDRNGLSKETMQDAAVLTVTALSKLSGEIGIAEDMLVESAQVLIFYIENTTTWFEEIKAEVKKVKSLNPKP